MSNLFSSPSKQAQAAATAAGNETANTVGQIENYTNQQAANLQNAVANAGPNPYFGAAASMSPSGYAVNPNDTITFGSAGPGTTYVAPNAFQAPAAASPAPTRTTGNEPTRPEQQVGATIASLVPVAQGPLPGPVANPTSGEGPTTAVGVTPGTDYNLKGAPPPTFPRQRNTA